MSKFYKVLFAAALICYGLSLVFPAVVYQPGSNLPQVVYGYDILSFNSISAVVEAITTKNIAILGIIPLNIFFGLWMVVVTTGAQAWFGNVLFGLAMQDIRKKSYRSALIFSSGAVLAGLLAFIFQSVPDGSEGGLRAYVDHLATGYYLWESSFIISALYCLLKFLQSRNKVGI